LPALLITGLPNQEAWLWVLISTVLHLFYYLFLAEAYRRADMSQVYPIARGAAPLVTTAISLVFIHDPIDLSSIVGIAVLGLGVLLISLRGQRGSVMPDRAAVVFALLTAGTISLYTIVDGIGARSAGSPNAYAAALFAVDAYPMLAICLWRMGLEGIRPAFKFLLPGFAGGMMSLAAYWIVIWAMTVAPIALVAATRETSVLFGGLIAIVYLKEPFTPVRAISAALILLGLVFMRMG
jgi:drug/metabolite transporter (DMT)-like permease